jgi:uncharacterized protein YcfJ
MQNFLAHALGTVHMKNFIIIAIALVIAGLTIALAIVYTNKTNHQTANIAQIQPISQAAQVLPTAPSQEGQLQQETQQSQIVLKPNKKPKPALAHILQVTPQYTDNSTKEPYQDCRNVTETVMVNRKKTDGTKGGVIGGGIGGITGAVIGNNVAQSNHGSVIGGAIGAVTGAVVGNQIEKRQTEQVPKQVTREVCKTSYRTIHNKKATGNYEVTYKYKGIRHTAITTHKPYGKYVSFSSLR